MSAHSIALQERDLSLLRGLFECRIMTLRHAANIYFDGKFSYAKTRLRQIKTAGFISERKRRAFEPAILFLTRKGLLILRERGILSEYPAIDIPVLEKRAQVSERTVRHELEVMDVKASFHSTVKKTNTFSVAEFTTWPMLHEFKVCRPGTGATIVVKPDGFVRLHENESDGTFEHTFFLELDRSSETLETLVARAACYVGFYTSGGFAERNGAPPTDYKKFPFRVLMVFKTVERRNNIALRLLQNTPPIRTRTYLSTYDEVMSDPFGTIWITPAGYHAATHQTAFESGQGQNMWGYKRQTERELFVEKTIKKVSLFDA